MTLSPMLDAELSNARCVSAPPIADETRDWSDVLRHVPPQDFERGDRIEGRYFVRIASGLVQARRSFADGHQVGMGIYGSGEYLFGADPLTVLSATALIQAWTGEQFQRAMTEAPGVCIAFLAERMGIATERAAMLANCKYLMKQRLALVLIRFALRFGTRNENGSFTLPALTQEALAFEIGTSRELVTGCMAALNKWPNGVPAERAIYYDRKAITIFPEKLRNAAGLPELTEEEHGR